MFHLLIILDTKNDYQKASKLAYHTLCEYKCFYIHQEKFTWNFIHDESSSVFYDHLTPTESLYDLINQFIKFSPFGKYVILHKRYFVDYLRKEYHIIKDLERDCIIISNTDSHGGGDTLEFLNSKTLLSHDKPLSPALAFHLKEYRISVSLLYPFLCFQSYVFFELSGFSLEVSKYLSPVEFLFKAQSGCFTIKRHNLKISKHDSAVNNTNCIDKIFVKEYNQLSQQWSYLFGKRT